MRFSNLEGLPDFDFVLPNPAQRPGVSALLRVKNEEPKLRHCLLSIAGLFREIVLVDNGSMDATVEVAREVAAGLDPNHPIRIVSYPHDVARCGPEHESTPATSLNSLVYFNNFGLSHCTSRYVCKWDGDMVLRRAARRPFARLLQRLDSVSDECWRLKGQTVYRDTSGDLFEARGEINKEVMLFPNRPGYAFEKHPHWEGIGTPEGSRVRTLRAVCFYELKYADEDEFGHWSTEQFPNQRKFRELDNFEAVRRGDVGSRRRFKRLPADFLGRQIP